jgi:hypothetical protein
MKKYYARICWNDQKWLRPAGTAKDGPKTFFGKYGFGFEEWLMDPSANVCGWQYAFLQPVNKGYNKRIGQALSLRLYSIRGGGEANHFEELEIKRCEVLAPDQALEIVKEFKRNGRIKQMAQQVRAVGGNPSPLTTTNPFCENILNVRFRMEDLLPLSQKPMPIRADYYSLYRCTSEADEAVLDTHPDELAKQEIHYEGARKLVYVNTYERNQRARSACLRKWGYKCTVCRMSFQNIYGPIGMEFIHVHHLKPLAKIGKKYVVDGERDLRPVCPNCHAMLHHGKKPPSIPELRSYIQVALRY